MKKTSLFVLLAAVALVGCRNTTSSDSSSSTLDNSSFVSSVEDSTSSSELVSSSEASSVSSSSKVAPTSIALNTDKTVLGLNESAILTLTVTGGNETIVPEISLTSPVEGTISKNTDGTYTVSRDSNANFGGIMLIEAKSQLDSSIKDEIELKFTTSLSEEHVATLSKTYDKPLGGIDFAGNEVKPEDATSVSFSKAEDGDYYNLTLGVGGKTYRYFSVYDFKRNEVQFASDTLYTGDYQSYNNLNLKMFDNYIDIYSASLKLGFATSEEPEEQTVAFDVSKVSFKTGGKELDETLEYSKDVGDTVMIAINTDTTEAVTYEFTVEEGASYVTKETSSIATACKYSINSNAAGQTIKIKASVSNGTLTASKVMTIKVNAAEIPEFCSDLIGTWCYQDIMEYTYKIVVTSESNITIEEYTDSDDETLVVTTFTASNILPISDVAVSFTITSSTGEDGELFVDEDDVVIEYDEIYESVLVNSDNLTDTEFTSEL